MASAIEVVAAVFIDDDRVLACRRRPDRSAPGKWEFPGGKVEAGETPWQALIREIAEELETEIDVLELIDRSSTEVNGLIVDLRCYLVRPLGALPTRSSDHDLLRWVPFTELGSLDWAEPDLPAVAVLTR